MQRKIFWIWILLFKSDIQVFSSRYNFDFMIKWGSYTNFFSIWDTLLIHKARLNNRLLLFILLRFIKMLALRKRSLYHRFFIFNINILKMILIYLSWYFQCSLTINLILASFYLNTSNSIINSGIYLQFKYNKYKLKDFI